MDILLSNSILTYLFLYAAHDESSQDQSMGTPEPVPKTHSTESNDNNMDSESSDESGDDSMNDDHVDPSDQPPESLANESIDSNQSKQSKHYRYLSMYFAHIARSFFIQ